ncbi:hypothetical protein RV15_GL000560 [Enterococcus silesiacus]|uniref:Uncharacterized protein n=1 Tax=Enterococcus silesiacus TaxID=332949 RepID=A0AA91GA83_9ENTE|nr:hypothetical protein RV15_GL000560 [Enterococcus silesiacus]
MIRETKAPDGSELSGDKIKIAPVDFGTNQAVLKNVVNKKIRTQKRCKRNKDLEKYR